MTILYKVESKDFSKDSVFPNKTVLCCVSAKNIIAFSVLQDVDVFATGTSRLSYHSHVYVADIITPWQYYKVCSSKALINVLKWSRNGECLLLGYRGGNIEIWSQKNYCINLWTMQYKANIQNEDIIQATFFHNDKSIYFNAQKKDLPFYVEKFERIDRRPTLASFGGAAHEGCIVVTSSGLLGAIIIPKKINTNITENVFGGGTTQMELKIFPQSIGLVRSYISHCCISHNISGALNIAISCGWQEQLIHSFKVYLKMDNEDRITIKTEPQANIFLNSLDNKKISHLKWDNITKEDVLFVVYECVDGSSVMEQWNFTRRHQSVHTLLQQNKNEYVQCESWEQTATQHFLVGISDICISKMLSDSTYIYVILMDNSVQILEQGLKKNNHIQFDGRHSACKFVCGDLSPTNQVLLIFDNNAQIIAMQTNNMHVEKSFKPNNLSLQVTLLEYCIVRGVDASDILMLNLNNLDALVEKLTENFSHQPTYTKHFYYSNFLALKSNICRIQSKQYDFDNLIILHSISVTFKSLLRPSDLSSQDKGPADNLSILLSEPVADVDTVLLNLDAKDFTVEPLTLQSLQQIIQWVADLALNMLNKLPEEIIMAKMNKKQGYDISRDIAAIGSIRELLVMIRIWGLLNPQCLPIYTTTVDNIDVLAILFRLLTRLTKNISEPDEMLLDECSLLSKQVLIPRQQWQNPTTLLTTALSTSRHFTLVFSTLVEPMGLQEIQMEKVIFLNGIRDGVSNLYSGSKAHPIRKCARCGFVNSIEKVTKTSALKAWCNKWIYCHCGGFWKITE